MPPLTKPYISTINSSSTLTIGQQSLFAALPKSAAKYPSSTHNTNPSTSRASTQIPPQRPDYGGPSSPGRHSGGGGVHGQQSEPINRRPSRKGTGTSEPPTPVPTDLHPYNYDRLREVQADAVSTHTGKVRKSHTDLQNTLSRNRSKRTVGGNDPHGSEGDGDGMYWSGRRIRDPGASRMSLFQIILCLPPDVHQDSRLSLDKGGPGQNLSRTFPCLVRNLKAADITSRSGSIEKLISRSSRANRKIQWVPFSLRPNQRENDRQSTEADLHNTNKSASRLNLTNMGTGVPLRQPSIKKPPPMNGSATEDARQYRYPL